MSLKKQIMTLILFFMFLTIGSAQAQSLKSYTNSAEGFTIAFPADWELQAGYMGTIVMSLSPISSETDMFRENVNIVSEKIPGPINAQQYYDANLSSMKKVLTEFSVLNKETVSLGGKPAILMTATHAMGKINAKALAAFVTHGGKGYVVTATATPETYDHYKAVFDEIIKSFSLQ